ncbi:Clp protease [Candidatus Saccharibacteria bacterium QS_5_54_17]|nr:MAG: Clp protease [Candidatus Saccharibacteria bacterium QS_5_54_17]
MDVTSLDARAFRMRAARYRHLLEGKRIWIWRGLLVLGIAAASVSWFAGWHVSITYLIGAMTILLLQLLLWWRLYLRTIPASAPLEGETIDPNTQADFRLLRGAYKVETPAQLWDKLAMTWPAQFIVNRLLLGFDEIAPRMSQSAEDLSELWQHAYRLSRDAGAESITTGAMVTALIVSGEDSQQWLRQQKLQTQDVINVFDWQHRTDVILQKLEQSRSFGGFARDWAAGYTPLLNRFGHDISTDVERGAYQHVYLQTHAQDLDWMLETMAQKSQNSLALIGKTGAGKTSLVYALAERMLDPRNHALRWHKVFSLDSTAIVSEANRSGNLEQLLLKIIGEARQAGNIILFFDDARSFLTQDSGAKDMTNILSQVVANNAARVLLALRPEDWQQLTTVAPDIATHIQQLPVREPDRALTLRVLEDQALAVEADKGVNISYPAIIEAYTLAERYLPDQAFPGKAISLLHSAAPQATMGWVLPETVQQTVESMTGAKVTAATDDEQDVLLNLEDHLRQRMVNQSSAVQVVSDALRRARAGVRDQERPVGSFLFLGPTGVGKTELSKSLAALYFGGEDRMIRVDMSEYNQPESTQRLLAPAGQEPGLLTAIRMQPFSVVLLDEVEKASDDVLNLLLQMLDEGQLTDVNGKTVSFRDAIVITTSNAGADTIRSFIEEGYDLGDFSQEFIDQLISDQQFKPELINRFDEVVLFRPLTKDELLGVVDRLVGDVNQNLADRQVGVTLTEAAARAIVDAGYDPRLGARPMRRVMQRTVENVVSKQLLSGDLQPGDNITLDAADLDLE